MVVESGLNRGTSSHRRSSESIHNPFVVFVNVKDNEGRERERKREEKMRRNNEIDDKIFYTSCFFISFMISSIVNFGGFVNLEEENLAFVLLLVKKSSMIICQ